MVWAGWAMLDRSPGLLQDGTMVRQMERSGLWLVRVRWNRVGLLKSPARQPMVDKSIAKDTSFIASGRRNESDNYLFLNRADADTFKGCIVGNLQRQVPPRGEGRVDIDDVPHDDVADTD